MGCIDRIRGWARRIKRDVVTLSFVFRHPATPWAARLLCVFVVGYALSPIDLIPDFIPVLGFLDDVLLLPALIWLAIRLVPQAVLGQCREQGDAWLAAGNRKPVSWWGAALVVAAWIALAWFGWRWWQSA